MHESLINTVPPVPVRTGSVPLFPALGGVDFAVDLAASDRPVIEQAEVGVTVVGGPACPPLHATSRAPSIHVIQRMSSPSPFPAERQRRRKRGGSATPRCRAIGYIHPDRQTPGSTQYWGRSLTRASRQDPTIDVRPMHELARPIRPA